MSWRSFLEIIKLCNTPASIISPIPFYAVSLFLISRQEFSISEDIPILFAGIAVTLLSNFGSNLWNHCNDIKEDIAQGKRNILTHDHSMQKKAFIISVLFYALSLLYVYFLSIELKKPIYIFFSIWMLMTWWYSDSLILKRLLGFRLKEHYLGEFITYSITCPMYTLSIWLIYSDLNLKGILISFACLFIGLLVMLLKDLKDISGDRKAGLKTFGVTFLPSQLIKYACYLMVLYYFVMLNPFTLNFFGNGILMMCIPFIYFMKNTFFHMYKKNWALDSGDLKALKGIGISIYSSFIFLGLSIIF